MRRLLIKVAMEFRDVGSRRTKAGDGERSNEADPLDGECSDKADPLDGEVNPPLFFAKLDWECSVLSCFMVLVVVLSSCATMGITTVNGDGRFLGSLSTNHHKVLAKVE